MYEVVISKNAEKQIFGLTKEMQLRVGNVLYRIRIRPHHFVKKYVGTPYYSLRIGDYRLILDIINDKLIILVVEVEHRKNVYK